MDKVCFVVIGLFFSLSLLAKDPTRPPLIETKKNADDVVLPEKITQPLTAIFIKNDKRLAIIENKIYQVGEYYRDARILTIDQDSVLLKSNQGNFQLTLIPNIKK